MDPRRILPILLLLACSAGASATFRNGRGGPDLVRRARRISLNEFLVPPPLPKFHPGRSGRLAALPAETPGYFAQLMNLLNPFSYDPPSPPPIPPPPDAPYPPSANNFIQPPPPPPPPPPLPSTSGISAKIHSDSSLPVYDRPPLPPVFNSHPEYRPPKKCNACNKVPWVPMQGEPQPLPPQLNNGYLPPSNPEVAHDAYHAASQEVGAPEFSFAPPPFVAGFDGPPHLYPDAMPPLFAATNFHHPVPPTVQGNSEHLGVLSSSGSGVSTENGSLPNAVGHSLNSEHSHQPIYPGSLGYPGAHQGVLPGVQGPLYIEPSASNNGLQHLDVQNHAHGDLSSSGTQVSQGSPNSLLGLENTATLQGSLDPANHHHTSPDASGVLNHQTSGAIDNGGFFDITGPNGPLGDLFDNSNQIGRNPPPESYGVSGFDRPRNRYEQRYNDLSSSGSASKNSHGPPQTPSDGSSTKIGDSIHFEESPLLDLTKKGESRTASSPISLTSNTLAESQGSHENVGVIGTTLATHQGLTPTRSHLLLADHLRTLESSGTSEKSEINEAVTRNDNGSLGSSVAPQGQKVPYVSLPDKSQVGYLWQEVSSTTLRSTEGESFLNTLLNFYDDEGEKLSQSVSVNSKDADEKQQGSKRNKQVQVIIPYTSQYTPLPFHSREQNHRRKISFSSEQDNYISEESKKNIKVASLPEPTNNHQTWPTTTSAKLEVVTGKPTSVKANNSINVHRLQKNIDNWTIQEYSKGTTASTMSPSSAKPYLFPSKQIPGEYLTTTESINHTDDPRVDNVKTFTLAGFSFNDLDHEGSASDHVEGSRVQCTSSTSASRFLSKVTQNENSKSTASTTETTVASTKDDVTWQGFYVDISPVDKERVFVVTPQPVNTTPSSKSNLVEQKREQASEKALKTDAKRTEKKMSTFESIEKAYQVLPQAVNNLAVASTGPDSVPLWGIMEHEEFASFDGSQHHHDDDDDNDNDDDDEENDDDESEIPVLYAGHSKVTRARR